MVSIDLNCDMGESTDHYRYDIGKDLALLEYVSSVNLACGFHAGDATTMRLLVEAAVEKGIAVGAHPSYPDRANFGRVNQNIPPPEIYDLVLYQLGCLNAFLRVHGKKLHHVKPHGALYNTAASDLSVAEAVAHAARAFDEELTMYALSGSLLVSSARQAGLRTVSEVFADRTYQDDGSLTPRTASDALLEDTSAVVEQVLMIAKQGAVRTITGKITPIDAQTICIHGDSDHALDFAKAVHSCLVGEGIRISPG